MIKFWRKKDIFIMNMIFSLLASSLQEILLFFALQLINISLTSTYNTISFILAIAWGLYELGIVIYLVKIFFSLNPDVVDKVNIKKKITAFRRKGKQFEKKCTSPKQGKKKLHGVSQGKIFISFRAFSKRK